MYLAVVIMTVFVENNIRTEINYHGEYNHEINFKGSFFIFLFVILRHLWINMQGMIMGGNRGRARNKPLHRFAVAVCYGSFWRSSFLCGVFDLW